MLAVTSGATPHFRVAILGTGFGGLGMAIRLKQTGEEHFVILERAPTLGGVWRDNTYPGAACDVPSHLYSFSFAPNPDWTHAYSAQPEIWLYLQACAKRFGLLPHCRFGHDVLACEWVEDAQHWALETSAGNFTADAVISGTGALSDPTFPELPGLKRFAGEVMHSARWNARYDFHGKRVAVVGTGASAIQLVPALQREAAQLLLFQRTPAWVMPRKDHLIPAWRRALYRWVPGLQRLSRLALYCTRELLAIGFLNPWLLAQVQKLAARHLRKAISDPALRAKLTPHYTLGCKRILVSDDYYPALNQPNVAVVTEALREVLPRAVVTADGREHPVDALVFATGFHVTDMPFAHLIRGRSGQTLAETWAGSPRAHLGTTFTGFPNLFLLQGPNTGLGHTSVLLMLESQFEHILAGLRFLSVHDLGTLEPTPEAQARFISDVDTKMAHTVWAQGGCQSWYLDSTGRNSAIWPDYTFAFMKRVEPFDPSEFTIQARRRRGARS